MQTHTLRNKSTQPILKLTPAFMKKCLAAHPEAFTLALHWFKTAYKAQTGKSPSLDYEQHQLFLERVGARPDGTWTSRFSTIPPTGFKVLSLFQSGFANASLSFEEALDMAQEFFDMLENMYFKTSKES